MSLQDHLEQEERREKQLKSDPPRACPSCCSDRDGRIQQRWYPWILLLVLGFMGAGYAAGGREWVRSADADDADMRYHAGVWQVCRQSKELGGWTCVDATESGVCGEFSGVVSNSTVCPSSAADIETEMTNLKAVTLTSGSLVTLGLVLSVPTLRSSYLYAGVLLDVLGGCMAWTGVVLGALFRDTFEDFVDEVHSLNGVEGGDLVVPSACFYVSFVGGLTMFLVGRYTYMLAQTKYIDKVEGKIKQVETELEPKKAIKSSTSSDATPNWLDDISDVDEEARPKKEVKGKRRRKKVKTKKSKGKPKAEQHVEVSQPRTSQMTPTGTMSELRSSPSRSASGGESDSDRDMPEIVEDVDEEADLEMGRRSTETSKHETTTTSQEGASQSTNEEVPPEEIPGLDFRGYVTRACSSVADGKDKDERGGESTCVLM